MQRPRQHPVSRIKRTMYKTSATSRKIAVIGAGICGLSTAICLQESDPPLDITIFAEKFSPDTTSDGAGAIWSPLGLGEDVPLETARRWAKATYEYLEEFLNSSEAIKYGVTSVSGYFLSDQTLTSVEPFKDIFSQQVRLSSEDIRKLNFPPDLKDGYFVTNLIVCCSFYLQRKLEEFKRRGGKVIKRRVQSFLEFVEKYHVVINCSGLGAHELCQDESLQPVRGQIMKVKAPWLKHFYRIYRQDDKKTGRSCCILPRPYEVVLGGTHGYGNDNTDIDQDDNDYIIDVTSKFEPTIKNAEVITCWVGLRPYRSNVRLEKELMKLTTEQGSQKTLQVVHNYGHGGSGVSVFWGCALEASDLALSYLKPMD